MKNLLKKIGVIGLSIAVLAPFIDLPEVKAAGDNCTEYQHSYIFLDVGWNGLDEYSGKGYTTYTTFPFEFYQQDGYTTTVTGATILNQMDEYQLNKYYEDLKALAGSVNEWRTAPNRGNYYNSYDNGKTRTALLHGVWAQADKTGTPLSAGWAPVAGIIDRAYQKTTVKNAIKVAVQASRYKDSLFSQPDLTSTGLNNGEELDSSSTSSTNNAITKLLQYIINNYDQAEKLGLVWEDTSNNNKKYVNFSVRRYLDETEARKITTYYKAEEDGTIICGYSDSDTEISNSYDAFKKDKENNCKSSGDVKAAVKSAIENNKNSTFQTNIEYYHPVVLNVDFKNCANSSPVEDGKWKLVYDGNANGDTSLTNVPEAETAKVGESIKVSSTTPKRTGISFVEWCETKDGKNCHKAGDTLTSDTEGVVTLYAKWQGTQGTTNNSKTGIASYIISFLAVGAIAGGIYYVSKKKNLFKQI